MTTTLNESSASVLFALMHEDPDCNVVISGWGDDGAQRLFHTLRVAIEVSAKSPLNVAHRMFDDLFDMPADRSFGHLQFLHARDQFSSRWPYSSRMSVLQAASPFALRHALHLSPHSTKIYVHVQADDSLTTHVEKPCR